MPRRRPISHVSTSRFKLSSIDERLLAGIQAGDRKLTAELCRRLEGPVERTLRRIMGRSDPDHHDLAQASFEHIVSSLRRGKFSGECEIATWAAAITGHVALHAIRSRRVERRVFDRSLHADLVSREIHGPSNPEAQVGARRDLETMRLHLGSMSKKLSEAVLLHDVLGFGIDETMALTGASKVAVQSRLTRGRRELSRRLGK